MNDTFLMFKVFYQYFYNYILTNVASDAIIYNYERR
nr:MAG TPA: hypothetical protein [Caudoviricetes sp.]